MTAERVQPPEASLKHAREVYAVHNYDKEANLSDVSTQRELSLLSAWDGLLRRIARHPSLGGDGFACIFGNDIALHDEVPHSIAMQAIVHGMDLARKDGLLYLSSCGPLCVNDPVERLDRIEYRKCNNPCSHAICVTKKKSRMLMSEIQKAWRADFQMYNYQSIEKGHCMDQMLRVYAEHSNSIWTVGTNLWSAQWLWYGDQLSCLLCKQDLMRQDIRWPLEPPTR